MEQAFGENLDGRKFSVLAYELWMYDGSWSVNDCWTIARDVDVEEVLKAARSRWEIFKVNYQPGAKVKDIDVVDFTIGPDNGGQLDITVNYDAFITIKEEI